jgi:hypothetical protein
MPDDVTSLSGATWQELYGQDTKGRPGVMLEASRRVVKALEASEQSSASLGKRIWWLNLWLLVFTIAICGLTLVLVVAEFFRRGHTHDHEYVCLPAGTQPPQKWARSKFSPRQFSHGSRQDKCYRVGTREGRGPRYRLDRGPEDGDTRRAQTPPQGG